MFVLAYVTGVAIKDDVYTEVDSVEITDFVWIEPVEKYYHDSESASAESSGSVQSEFFCLNDNMLRNNFSEVFASKEQTQGTKGMKRCTIID